MVDEVSEEEALFEDEAHEEILLVPETKAEEDAPIEGEKPAEIEAESEPLSDKEDTGHKPAPALIPYGAYKDEKRKRQSLEDEVNSLRKQVPVSDEAPDPYEDIDAYTAYMRNQWQHEQNMAQEQARNARINESRSKMLETHADYDEMEQVFQLMAVSDKTLVDKMFASGNEAKFAYDTAVAYKKALLSPATETVETETKTEAPISMPNLATATAQAKNTQALEKEADIEDVFADMGY